jgi:hypothetical protein
VGQQSASSIRIVSSSVLFGATKQSLRSFFAPSSANPNSAFRLFDTAILCAISCHQKNYYPGGQLVNLDTEAVAVIYREPSDRLPFF